MTQVVAPQAGLRLKVQLLVQRVVQIFFFAVDERGNPQSGLHVGAPAIEVEKEGGMAAAAVSAVEANHVEILILYPNASQKAALAGFILGRDVEHQAAHFAKKLATHIIEFIVLFVQSTGIDKNHLQKAIGQKLQAEGHEVSDRCKELLAFGTSVAQGDDLHALSEIRAPQEVFVAGRRIAQILVRLEILNVGFDQWRIGLDLRVQLGFVGNHAVNHLVHGSRRGAELLKRSALRPSVGSQSAHGEQDDCCEYLTHFLSPSQ